MKIPVPATGDRGIVVAATVITAATAVLWAPLTVLSSPGWSAAGPVVFAAAAGILALLPQRETTEHHTELAGVRCDPTGPIHAAMTALTDAGVPAHDMRLHRSKITDGSVHHELVVVLGDLTATVAVTPWGNDTAVGFAACRTISPLRRTREIIASAVTAATAQHDHESRTREGLSHALAASMRHAQSVALQAARDRVPAVSLGTGRVVATASWDPARLLGHVPKCDAGPAPLTLSAHPVPAFDPYDEAENSLLH